MPYFSVFANLVQLKPKARTAAIVGTVLFFIPLLLLGKASAQPGTLLAINEGESTLSIINPQTGQELARVAEGGVAGHEVVASFDGRTAYVPIYGDSSAGDPGSDGSELVAIDLASHRVVGHIDFGHGVRPHQPVLNPHDGMLYVTTELDQTITVIDPKTCWRLIMRGGSDTRRTFSREVFPFWTSVHVSS
jgi:hypothetical protein